MTSGGSRTSWATRMPSTRPPAPASRCLSRASPAMSMERRVSSSRSRTSMSWRLSLSRSSSRCGTRSVRKRTSSKLSSERGAKTHSQVSPSSRVRYTSPALVPIQMDDGPSGWPTQVKSSATGWPVRISIHSAGAPRRIAAKSSTRSLLAVPRGTKVTHQVLGRSSDSRACTWVTCAYYPSLPGRVSHGRPDGGSGPVHLMGFVLVYRCGAVSELHRVPFLSPEVSKTLWTPSTVYKIFEIDTDAKKSAFVTS